MLKIISCAGFGGTGSSVVTDFFSEFSSIYIVGGSSFEFFLLHENDGILDLEYALTEGNRLKTDLAIKRFIKLVNDLNFNNPSGPNYKDFFNGNFLKYTYDYLDSLGIIKWNKGWWHRISETTPENKKLIAIKRERFNKLLKKSTYSLYEACPWKPSYLNCSEQYFCHISKEEFVSKTKKYLEKLFLEMAQDNEYILFDQLFPTNVDPDYLDYFDFAKVIIVDRDPRDLYFMNKVFWGCGYIPSENVDVYVKWFKETRKNVSENPDILCINFEDMIFDTENTQKRLCDFTGIDIRLHDKPRTVLFVEKSITNTQVFNRYLITDKEINACIQNDLELIEKELKDYIYDFPAVEKSEIKEQSFVIENIYKKVEDISFFDYIYLVKIFIKKVWNKIKRVIKSIL